MLLKADCNSLCHNRRDGDQASFLGAVSGGAENSWLVYIRIKKQIVSFKMDTGAEVMTASGDTYQSLGEPRLRKPTIVLYGPAHQPLDVMGQLQDGLGMASNLHDRTSM